ncbi:MAG: DUF4124 domain-containing protein [Gammaproteobacteria bacterium]
MKLIPTLRLLVILTTASAAAATHADRRTYKWIDADGNVTYSSRMPPESTQHERKVINKQGRVIKIYNAPLTAEEKVEQERLAELAAKKKERARKRAIHDRSLLATYSNSKDMEKARDAKVSLIKSLMHLTNSRIKSMQSRLLTLSEEAAQFERSGKQLPFTLHSQITNLRDQIAHNKRIAKDKEAEVDEVKRQFAMDIARYEELTADEPQVVKRGPTPLEIASNNPNITLDRHDRTLLTTFSSEEDLLFARNEELENIDFNIRQAYDRIDTMQNHLAELSNNADEYEADGEILPDTLLVQMKQVMAEITETEALLMEKRVEKQKILGQFEQDIQRFRVLTASN